GHDIWLYDTEQSRIAEIPVVAGGILDELISCDQFTAPGKENVLKRLHGTTSLVDIADSQLLIEAIPERLELKHALYA
ncbi:3-hydroxyacyl-CoA dehydrogenase NAD-binding domain-containing protein, partial [Escherichia coli]|nr:3-hydroxyacyl-CoA dehydrogenase NAD-binding domain-containing protein [Escherichia coli]